MNPARGEGSLTYSSLSWCGLLPRHNRLITPDYVPVFSYVLYASRPRGFVRASTLGYHVGREPFVSPFEPFERKKKKMKKRQPNAMIASQPSEQKILESLRQLCPWNWHFYPGETRCYVITRRRRVRGVLVARTGAVCSSVLVAWPWCGAAGAVGGTRTRSITWGGSGRKAARDGRRRTVNRFVDAWTVEEGNVSPGVLGKVPKRFLQGSRLVWLVARVTKYRCHWPFFTRLIKLLVGCSLRHGRRCIESVLLTFS